MHWRLPIGPSRHMCGLFSHDGRNYALGANDRKRTGSRRGGGDETQDERGLPRVRLRRREKSPRRGRRMKVPRIISFLPAATEMAYALGLGDSIVGVSHECDFPPEARNKPVVVKPALALEKMSLREIDVAVASRIGSGQSLYEVDENLLRELKPDMILTQNLCQVCGPSGNEITVALKLLRPRPEVVWMSPHSLEDIFENIRDLGTATGRSAQAEQLLEKLRDRLQRVSALARNTSRRPPVFCLEWIDPYYCCGHWVPEMIEMAGGIDAIGRKGVDSVRVSWTDIVAWAPEILIVSPCGFDTRAAVQQARQLIKQPGWSGLPAVRKGQIYAVNANAYFAKPGPRVVDGVELLAHLIHPELCTWSGPADAFQKIEAGRLHPGPVRSTICTKCGADFEGGPQNRLNHSSGKETKIAPPTTPGIEYLCLECLTKATQRRDSQIS